MATRTTKTNSLNHRVTAAGDARRQHQQPTKTSSRCVAEGETVTHDFEVARYSQLIKTLGVGQYVTSGTFSAGGHDWAIRLYPKQHGAGVDHRPPLFHAGACLQLCDAAAVAPELVTARFTLCLVRNDGRASPMATEAMTAAFGAPPRDRHGFHKLLPDAGKLRAWRCLHNDAVTVRCVVTVVRATHPVPPPELAGDLGRLLATGMGADVTLDVGGRAFPAHRVVLAARSPVFRAELFGGMMEKDARRIKIAGVRPEVFGLLLRFVYTESLPGDGEGCDAATMRRLLVAADLYGLDRLKRICEGKLHASIDERTVASMLALAERHNCPRLRDACLAFTSSSLAS
ncbi:unnamed protein product [Urochloa decumbens]|uniref:Uncharacterized protein n=1 Tax=Urochloa decumbens TaxID=240449 RepID=A0ABC9C701_9POAL